MLFSFISASSSTVLYMGETSSDVAKYIKCTLYVQLYNVHMYIVMKKCKFFNYETLLYLEVRREMPNLVAQSRTELLVSKTPYNR